MFDNAGLNRETRAPVRDQLVGDDRRGDGALAGDSPQNMEHRAAVGIGIRLDVRDLLAVLGQRDGRGDLTRRVSHRVRVIGPQDGSSVVVAPNPVQLIDMPCFVRGCHRLPRLARTLEAARRPGRRVAARDARPCDGECQPGGLGVRPRNAVARWREQSGS